MNYVYAAQRPWNLRAFLEKRHELPGSWLVAATPQDLELVLAHHDVRYVFFPHWSDIVPDHVLESNECVCFHMTDVPYGRGGSPLQNLLLRGHEDTVLSALRMTGELDAGPVYMKRPLPLGGSAEKIFERAAGTILSMIAEIVAHEPDPVAQVGQVTRFRRRTPEDSRLPETGDLDDLHTHIRMLDAPGYPSACIDHGAFRLRFTHSERQKDQLHARVVIEKGDIR